MWCHSLVISDLGSQKDADPWNSLAIQPSLRGEFQANERACLKKSNQTRERPQKEIKSQCPNPREQSSSKKTRQVGTDCRKCLSQASSI